MEENDNEEVVGTGQDAAYMDEPTVQYEARIRQLPIAQCLCKTQLALQWAMRLENSAGSDLALYKNPCEVNIEEELRGIYRQIEYARVQFGKPAVAKTMEQNFLSSFWRNQRLEYCTTWPRSYTDAINQQHMEIVNSLEGTGQPLPVAIQKCKRHLEQTEQRRRDAKKRLARTGAIVAANIMDSGRDSQYERAVNAFRLTPIQEQTIESKMIMEQYVKRMNGEYLDLEFVRLASHDDMGMRPRIRSPDRQEENPVREFRQLRM